MSKRDQDEFDRDFSAMVSGLSMEGFSPASPPPAPAEPPDLRVAPKPDPTPFNLTAAMEAAEPDEPERSDYVPPPLPPLRAPSHRGAIGWLCFSYVLITLVLTVMGVPLPAWAGWIAVVALIAAVLIGWRSLPKDRDPDDDGAVV